MSASEGERFIEQFHAHSALNEGPYVIDVLPKSSEKLEDVRIQYGV